MKKYISKIREWLRALLREELALVITEFHEIKDVRLVQAENEAAKLLQDFEQKLVAEAAAIVTERNKLIAELHEKLEAAQRVAHEMLHTCLNTVEEHFTAERAALEDETKKLLKDFEQKLSAEAATVITGKNVAIAELREKINDLQSALHKVTHWRADSAAVEADHSLKMVK